MDEIQENLEPQGTSRRTVMKGAAWAAPVVAVAAAVPMAAASVVEPEEAVGVFVGAGSQANLANAARIALTGLDANGLDEFFPDGQTFTVASTFPWDDIVIASITGGTISGGIITPNSGATSVVILFRSATPGTYTVTSNGPAGAGESATGRMGPA